MDSWAFRDDLAQPLKHDKHISHIVRSSGSYKQFLIMVRQYINAHSKPADCIRQATHSSEELSKFLLNRNLLWHDYRTTLPLCTTKMVFSSIRGARHRKSELNDLSSLFPSSLLERRDRHLIYMECLCLELFLENEIDDVVKHRNLHGISADRCKRSTPEDRLAVCQVAASLWMHRTFQHVQPSKEILQQVELDVKRTFVDSEYMLTLSDSITRLLVAFAVSFPEIGYCQGLNAVAAMCLQLFDNDIGISTVVFFQLISSTCSRGYPLHGNSIAPYSITPGASSLDVQFCVKSHVGLKLAALYGQDLSGVARYMRVMQEIMERRHVSLWRHLSGVGFKLGLIVPAQAITIFLQYYCPEAAAHIWDFLVVATVLLHMESDLLMVNLLLASILIHQKALMLCTDLGEVMSLLKEDRANSTICCTLIRTLCETMFAEEKDMLNLPRCGSRHINQAALEQFKQLMPHDDSAYQDAHSNADEEDNSDTAMTQMNRGYIKDTFLTFRNASPR